MACNAYQLSLMEDLLEIHPRMLTGMAQMGPLRELLHWETVSGGKEVYVYLIQ